MARTETQTRQLFDGWAASYDQDLLEKSGPLVGYSDSLKVASALLPISADESVLDIGIGSGAFAVPFLERGARIMGIDLSEKMLEKCRQSYPMIELHQGTFTVIPASDAVFDHVISSFVFHEVAVSERPSACRELARVLKPGGFVALLDIMFASEAAQDEARRLMGDAWDDEEIYTQVGDLDALLRAEGFTALQWHQTGVFHWFVIARKPATL